MYDSNASYYPPKEMSPLHPSSSHTRDNPSFSVLIFLRCLWLCVLTLEWLSHPLLIVGTRAIQGMPPP